MIFMGRLGWTGGGGGSREFYFSNRRMEEWFYADIASISCFHLWLSVIGICNRRQRKSRLQMEILVEKIFFYRST